MNEEYKVSTIIPVYNTEQYLEKAIKSVINQSIGFKNIQLILVNDGSPDNSEAICLKYKKMYPNNIVYQAKENGGVSTARNLGLSLAKGKYINFLDADDYLDKDFYEKAYAMLEEHQEIDLVAARLKFFEKSKKYHFLDYKFTGDRIIDILKEPESILLHINSTLIRTDVMRKFQFDTRLKISEDTKVLYDIILEKEKYGILSSCIYHYRKRANETSAIQTSKKTNTWYTDTLKYCHNYLIDLSMKKYQKVICYVQYFLMYDLQWRVKTEVLQSLSEDEKTNYIEEIRKYIKLIDDEVILAQREMSINYKQIALKIKYEQDYDKYLNVKENGIYFKDNVLILFDELENYVELSEVKGDKLIVEGNIVLNDFEFGYRINGEKHVKIETYERKPVKCIFKEHTLKKDGYTIQIPLENVRTIQFEVKYDDKYQVIPNKFIHFSHINNLKYGYYYEKPYLITKNENTIIVKYKPSIFKLVVKELLFLGYIFLKRRQLKIGIQRTLYWITKPFIPKNLWLFSDREFMGRDSGELMF